MEFHENNRPAHTRHASETSRTTDGIGAGEKEAVKRIVPEDKRQKLADRIKSNTQAYIPDKEDMLALYPVESLFYREATQEEMELEEQFFKLSDRHRRRDILFQLVRSTTDTYVDAYLSGEPYPIDAIIDKLMDTKDWQTRKKIIAEAGITVSDKILQSIPYMPLNDDEKRCVRLFGSVDHCRSPHRKDDYSQKWSDMTEKEQTVIKIMDADHRLTFEVAVRIVDAYEKKLMENEQEKQPPKSRQASLNEENIFWLDYGNDSLYLKRQAYANLKLANQDITDEALRQAGANLFLNFITLELTPILHPLVAWAMTRHYERLVEGNLP